MKATQTECMKALATFAAAKDATAARQCIQDLVKAIGPGFHPDTPFSEYEFPDGTPLFDADAAGQMEEIIGQLIATLSDQGIDPCEVALPVQRALLNAESC